MPERPCKVRLGGAPKANPSEYTNNWDSNKNEISDNLQNASKLHEHWSVLRAKKIMERSAHDFLSFSIRPNTTADDACATVRRDKQKERRRRTQRGKPGKKRTKTNTARKAAARTQEAQRAKAERQENSRGVNGRNKDTPMHAHTISDQRTPNPIRAPALRRAPANCLLQTHPHTSATRDAPPRRAHTATRTGPNESARNELLPASPAPPNARRTAPAKGGLRLRAGHHRLAPKGLVIGLAGDGRLLPDGLMADGGAALDALVPRRVSPLGAATMDSTATRSNSRRWTQATALVEPAHLGAAQGSLKSLRALSEDALPRGASATWGAWTHACKTHAGPTHRAKHDPASTSQPCVVSTTPTARRDAPRGLPALKN